MKSKRTQDLIFTLFGDYISHRGDRVWIGALIRLLKALGVSEQAVRSTTSRMSRRGWLVGVRSGRNSYYSMTPRMIDLLMKGGQKIYYPLQDNWNGHWYLITYSLTDDLEDARQELRKHLSWLGFGRLSNGTWVSPHDRRDEIQEVLSSLGIQQFADYFRACHVLPDENNSLVRRCWDLNDLHARYQRFIQKHKPQFERDCQSEANGGFTTEYAFRQRFWLVHEYRYFPFSDPYLPRELLPEDWPGYTAIDLFRAYHDLLKDKANAYVDEAIAQEP